VTTHQQGSVAEAIAVAFARLYQAVNESPATAAQKAVAQQAVEKLEQEARKGESTDEAEVQQWFDVLTAMLPEVAAVAVDAFLRPIKGVSAVFAKIAAKKRGGT
jgi:DNA/RNA-binding domain of Phe-tRNA-synthetase-like protein